MKYDTMLENIELALFGLSITLYLIRIGYDLGHYDATRA